VLACAAAFVIAARRAARLRPETQDARAWDRASRPFLAIALLRAAIAIAQATVAHFVARTTP
jgi:hypothetical protein